MVVSAGLTTAIRVRQAAEEARSELLSLQSALKAARAEKVCRSPCARSYGCHASSVQAWCLQRRLVTLQHRATSAQYKASVAFHVHPSSHAMCTPVLPNAESLRPNSNTSSLSSVSALYGTAM